MSPASQGPFPLSCRDPTVAMMLADTGFSEEWNNTSITLALDPSGKYQHCSLEYSRVAVIRDKLFLDGGETRLMLGSNSNTVYGINTRLLWMDLTKPFNYSSYQVLSDSKPWGIPSLGEGHAFVPSSSSTKFYAFGGYYPSTNSSAIDYVAPPVHADEVGLLWSYDVESQLWDTEEKAGTVTGLSEGSPAVNTFLNEAYLLGGLQDSWVLRDSPEFFVDGLMALNMTSLTWRNETVPGPSQFGAFMEYLPVGKEGVLVVFGGRNYAEATPGDSGSAVDMKQIRIYDVASGTWLSQEASGTPYALNEVPDSRFLGCSAMAPAPDNSSYNIYIFGGELQFHGAWLKDIWILSLPSFTWIKIMDDQFGAVANRCRRIGRHMFSLTPSPYDEAQCQEFFRIFDLTDLDWTNQFDPNAPPYAVPPAISAVVGGNSTGGASVLRPVSDSGQWEPSLQDIFAITPWGPANFSSKGNATNNAGHSGTSTMTSSSPTLSQTETTTPGDTGLSKGAIAGVAVGATMGFFLVIFALWLVSPRVWLNNKRGIDSSPVGNDEDSNELHGKELPITQVSQLGGREIVAVPGIHELRP